jgi:hypothetical protein
MKPWKNEVNGFARTSPNVIQHERDRKPISVGQAGLMNRVMGIDCLLADIELEMQRLRDERIHLRLVREELTKTHAGGSLQ